MKKTATLLLFGLLAACGDGEKKGMSAAGPGASMPPPEVEVIVLQAGSATLTQDLPGRLSAIRSAQVRARIEGVVEKRLFVEGSDISAGTPLFQIDARTYQAQAAAAEADLAAAKAVFARYAPLLEIKAVSQQEFDAAGARFKQAEAALAKARLDLENAVPPAPISGRIGRALVTEGALVGRGEATHLATIEQLDPIYANFTQPGADLLRLRQAVKAGRLKQANQTRVELILDDGSVFPQTGKLLFSDLAVDPSTGSVALRALFPNPGRELLPGSFVRVRFPEAIANEVIRLPLRAVQAGPEGQFVMVVDAEGKAVPRLVKTAGISGSDFLVGGGVKAGEKVIVNGLQKTRPGMPVKAVPWTAAPTSPAPSAAPAASPSPVGEKK
ncbi:MAG: efflux RND transporter periplasmic adaptor subunit [Rhodocyclales bacterium]|nr:efflux RND transporter periplasmic adaptor subunit [Rhodocyclales bacterium]